VRCAAEALDRHAREGSAVVAPADALDGESAPCDSHAMPGENHIDMAIEHRAHRVVRVADDRVVPRVSRQIEGVG